MTKQAVKSTDSEAQSDVSVPPKKEAYRVLARKYRPQNFNQLIGQEALVRTLTNAIKTGRLHHAYMLHGIRGVGKTTTARIMARALNYGGKDGEPSAELTELTDQCKLIVEGRHVDVIEMDAASNTGVDNIREIIDSVQYAPATARYKVYIIDEVHMLSKSAFNALLKTLEEPPEHVKFIFATTEIRKVPVTVLSRCQRFDLKRVDREELKKYYAEICEKEGVTFDDDALFMIAKAADGSVRDGLSLLDQAIALSDGHIEAERVKNMLGLADQGQILDLFEACMKGQTKQAFDVVSRLYDSGAEPQVVISDMLSVTHQMTKYKADADLLSVVDLSISERARNEDLSSALNVPILTRAWQILSKGLMEVNQSSDPQAALEMVIIRLLYTSDLPTPGDLVKMLKSGDFDDALKTSETSEAKKKVISKSVKTVSQSQDNQEISKTDEPQPLVEDVAPQSNEEGLNSFKDVVHLFEEKREILIASNLRSFVKLVSFEPLKIELNLLEQAPRTLTNEVASMLREWTGDNWVVQQSSKDGEPTITEQEIEAKKNLFDKTKAHPDIQKLLSSLEGLDMVDIQMLDKTYH